MTWRSLSLAPGLVASRGEARRKTAEGALSIDGERVTDVDVAFTQHVASVLLRFGQEALPACRASAITPITGRGDGWRQCPE
jgi:tyrosyl-tRNA synthetase